MAKGKPSRAFLEALQQQKRTRGETKPGGGFTTPEWFFNKEAAEPAPPVREPLKPAPMGNIAGPMAPRTRGTSNRSIYIAVASVVLVVTAAAIYFKISRQPAAAPAAPVAVEQQRPNSSVLDVAGPRQTNTVQPPAPKAVMPPPMANVASPTQQLGTQPQAQSRVVGMNYVIFTGYPRDQEQLAHEAAAALNAAGIGATVEKGLAGFQWYTVVGTTGFARISVPEYQDYLRKVDAVSEQFAGPVKWKRFQPAARKWQ